MPEGGDSLKEKNLDFLAEITEALANRSALEGLLRILIKMIAKSVLIIDAYGRVLTSRYLKEESISSEKVFLPISIKRGIQEGPVEVQLITDGSKLHATLWPIRSESCMGWIVVLCRLDEISSHHQDLTYMVSLAAQIELSKQKEIKEVEQFYKSEFIRDLVFNNFSNLHDMKKACLHWNIDINKKYLLMVVAISSINPNFDIAEIEAELENSLAKKTNCIIGQIGDGFVLLIALDELKNWYTTAKSAYAKIQSDFPIEIICGVGNPCESLNVMYKGYQEAKVALELGKIMANKCSGLFFFKELGAIRLFYNQRIQDLEDFCEENLGPILQYDKEYNGQLVQTLQCFLSTNCNRNLCTSKLFIHANTLRYRLKQIEKLLNVDLESNENRFNLTAALKVLTILRDMK